MKEVRYFYVPDATDNNELPELEAHHAVKVLRMKTGDELFLMDGKGYFHKAIITLTTGKRCYYEITESIKQDKTWNGKINLAIAPTKDIGRMEWMSEKITEIGFDSITFLDCDFSERKTLRNDRIEKIIVSAAKQSRKPLMPVSYGMASFRKIIERPFQGKTYICHCYDEIERNDFMECLRHTATDDEITILVGPEGDFSTEEVRKAIEKGAVPVSLGKSRLRTETAGLMAVAISQMYKRN